ncbi:helicase-related protein [Clavibacter sp. MX14-G9D]|uniref:helicase-related protein n=1 Tax=Clavibacter sp. MX14-G9D TaxID=3064656 RepID=UPI00293EC5F8|nr:helicase-related protein [Clavibacter sp. MX14-G9D]
MTLTRAQKIVLSHLRSAYIGPDSGESEVIYNPPNRQYSVGMLYPRDAEPEADDGVATHEPDDVDIDLMTASDGEMEESGAAVPIAEDWRPSSAAISFITDSDTVVCSVAGATYAAIEGDGPPSWRRTPFTISDLTLSPDRRVHEQTVGGVPVEIGSRWRDFRGARLVTVHLRVLATSTGDDRLDAISMLYQVALAVSPIGGGTIREYDTRRAFDIDDESAELRLRYRNRKVFAVGHGMAADWTVSDGLCSEVRLDPVPHFVVPDVETTGFKDGTLEANALRLEHLATLDKNADQVLESLRAFVHQFGVWILAQEELVDSFGREREIAGRIVGRSKEALSRMNGSLDRLGREGNGTLRTAFSLAMAAMRLQMQQAVFNRDGSRSEPQWRPFQLGFLLVALDSTADDTHEERGLVDLIWFPTGGGKTEAYLGLAAIEIFRRRLSDGSAGGGTAVLTRYTLRLLTSQQFQRAASLVCAMELLRRSDKLGDPRAIRMTPFSIGLWVGNEVTPGTRKDAKSALERLHKAARPEEANQFQVESCPWCATPLLPRTRSPRQSEYGVRMMGRDIVIYCVNSSCEFADEIPVRVVDEMLYEEPPTILLATVDKFARLQFLPQAGRLLGLNTAFHQPSLIVQDELHLLSGPLGTTVAVFDAVVQMLLAANGSTPKIVASTATIRASDDQVQGLYGRKVALYPPSGLDDDTTFFSRPVTSGEGRLYLGLMPQALSQMSATVSASAPLIEIPEILRKHPDAETSLDAYWTAVMYHNSLRELGRTGTLVVDDVNARLEPRADRLEHELRTVRAGRVLELTSRRGPEELPNDLRELRQSADESDQAVDVVLSSNMLSVGIDIPRLALMLMVGQPKTTSEYIQATSRVGRGKVRGIVATLFRSNRARDRSHFETFRGYHDALYRSVEPTSVTPWSLASRERSLAGALVVLIRHLGPGLSSNDAAKDLDLDNAAQRALVDMLVDGLIERVANADSVEVSETRGRVNTLLSQWDRRARAAREASASLLYDRAKADDSALFKRFGQSGEGWLVADSMRSVEPNVAVEVREPYEEGSSAKDQA